MALRLRRGTNAERLTITPEIGELIYTTDTKKVFVGDGTTEGGVAIDTGLLDLDGNSLNDLGDVSTATPTDSQVLAWNDANSIWEPADAATPDLSASVIGDLGDVAIGVIDINQTLVWDGTNFVPGSAGGSLVDESTPTLGSDLDANSNNIINVNQINASTFNGTHLGSHAGDFSGDLIGTFQGSVYGNDSTLVFNADDNTITAADIQAVTFIATDSFNGLLVGQVQGQLTGDVFADDGLTRILNSGTDGTDATFTGTVTGSLVGDVEGDIRGSVFAFDSTMIIDGLDGKIVGDVVGKVSTEQDILFRLNQGTAPNAAINFEMFRGSKTAPIQPNNFDRTFINWKSYDVATDQYVDTSLIAGYHQTGNAGYLALSTADTSGVFFNTAAELDGITQKFVVTAPGGSTFSGSIKPGVYADAAARDTAIPTPTAGEMVFITALAQFQGYDGSAWVALN